MDAANDPLKTEQRLLIGDLAKRLKQMASIEQDARTGNPSISEALTLLAGCLARHKSKPVSELAQLQLEKCSPRTRQARKPLLKLPERLDSLGWDQVSAILDNDQYQKKQLVELGERRLGIPRGRLSRQKRSDAIASIRAALDNERALSVIGHQARLAGERRNA